MTDMTARERACLEAMPVKFASAEAEMNALAEVRRILSIMDAAQAWDLRAAAAFFDRSRDPYRDGVIKGLEMAASKARHAAVRLQIQNRNALDERGAALDLLANAIDIDVDHIRSGGPIDAETGGTPSAPPPAEPAPAAETSSPRGGAAGDTLPRGWVIPNMPIRFTHTTSKGGE